MKYYYDNKRHLVCVPYSVENLHIMANKIGINSCWFHNSKFKHYDIPKKMMNIVSKFAIKITQKQILLIIKGYNNEI